MIPLLEHAAFYAQSLFVESASGAHTGKRGCSPLFAFFLRQLLLDCCEFLRDDASARLQEWKLPFIVIAECRSLESLFSFVQGFGLGFRLGSA